MKKIIFPALFTALILFACGGQHKEAANNMAKEMCQAMELIKADDPMSMIEAASAMTKIAEKADEYGKVTQDELIKAMKEICPEGAKKYMDISATATDKEE